MKTTHAMSLTDSYRYYYTAIIMLNGHIIAAMAPYRDSDSFNVEFTNDAIIYQVLGTSTVYVQYS
jgi:hypothetical protein